MTKNEIRLLKENEELKARLEELEASLKNSGTSEILSSKNTGIPNASEGSKGIINETERQLMMVSENLPVLVSMSSVKDSVVVYTNSAYNKAFGYTRDEVLGKDGHFAYYNPALDMRAR